TIAVGPVVETTRIASIVIAKDKLFGGLRLGSLAGMGNAGANLWIHAKSSPTGYCASSRSLP
ncbi:MAG TPA: hypothetical protein PLJ27_06575, partial [Polyangiaceae bacterium]|nr:hypothetical protein [Polyangiaceae bacterium]